MIDKDVTKYMDNKMELFYQRDRANTDLLFKEILKEQRRMRKEVDKIELLLNKLVDILTVTKKNGRKSTKKES